MASSNYTSNLHLSAWQETDRPKRADFVSDNSIIDETLGGHINNGNIHMTAAEKSKLSEPFVTMVYGGSGESERTFSLGFVPKFVMVFKRNAPFVTYSSGVNIVNSGYASYGNGSTAGISVSGSGNVVLTEQSTPSNGMRVSLNEDGSQYSMVAFK